MFLYPSDWISVTLSILVDTKKVRNQLQLIQNSTPECWLGPKGENNW